MEDKKKNETRQSTMQNRMENMNGQKPKTISIVISVYNEKRRCMSSIGRQLRFLRRCRGITN